MAITKFKGIYSPEEHKLMLEDYDNKIEACVVKKNKFEMEKAAFIAYYTKQQEFKMKMEEELEDNENA